MRDEGLEQGEVVHFHTEQRKEAEDTGRGSLIHSGEAQRNQRGMRTQGRELWRAAGINSGLAD